VLGNFSEGDRAGHKRRGLGFRAFTITGRGVTGTVATAAAGGTTNSWRIWRSSSSAIGSQPANLMSPRISGHGSRRATQPAPPAIAVVTDEITSIAQMQADRCAGVRRGPHVLGAWPAWSN
jgi:hypothetical protein